MENIFESRQGLLCKKINKLKKKEYASTFVKKRENLAPFTPMLPYLHQHRLNSQAKHIFLCLKKDVCKHFHIHDVWLYPSLNLATNVCLLSLHRILLFFFPKVFSVNAVITEKQQYEQGLGPKLLFTFFLCHSFFFFFYFPVLPVWGTAGQTYNNCCGKPPSTCWLTPLHWNGKAGMMAESWC